MKRINNPMEIFKILPQTNCRDCNEKTCMAFAVAVFKNRKPLSACPHLSSEVLAEYGGDTQKPNTIDEDMTNAVDQLKSRIRGLDLAAAADRVNGKFNGSRLTIKVFGKDFAVDADGKLYSDIHVNPWVAVPVLDYIMNAKGAPPSGNWLTFRELEQGMPRFALFQQRCEKPLKQVADTYPELFEDMLDIFDGKKIQDTIDSDISIVLYPLPLVPIKISYWYPEDGLESSLHIFFDATSRQNLSIDSIYTLSGGIVNMFGKIALRHGVR